MKIVDALDRAILFELDINARQSISQIARRVHQGRDRVEYRLERLKERGILHRCYAVVNPYRLGNLVFDVNLNLRNNPKMLRSLDKLLEAMPTTFWLNECSGRWDRIFSVFAPSPRALYSILTDLLARFSALVIDYEVATIVNTWFGYRHWLKCSEGSGSFFYGGALERCTFDVLDNTLLLELIRDARAHTVELADRLGTSPEMVTRRIDRLVNSGIVVAFRAEIDLDALGMLLFRVRLFLSSAAAQERVRLRDFCLRHPNIVSYTEMIADSPVELEIETETFQQFNRVVAQLGEKFAQLIQTIDTVFIARSWASQTCNFLTPLES